MGRTPEQIFESLAQEQVRAPEVSFGGKGFGSNGLKARGKIYAMLVRGNLVVKLPKERVEELVATGVGEPFDPRHDGKLMKEWVTVGASHSRRWGSLVQAAKGFVAS